MKDKERNGRPPSVSKELMVKIRKELEDSNTGWDFRQVMDLIYKRARVRYHEVHIYRLLHKWGFKPKVLQKKICKYCFNKGEKEIQKRVKLILKHLDSNCTVLVQDESIFVYDYVIRKKKWISKDKRPVVKVTGSRNKTIIFGCLSIEGKQLFRQCKKFDSSIFVDYLKQLQKRFGKCIVFVDRATPHCSKVTKAYLDANKDTIRLEYFPIGAPEFNATEECWRQGKYHILYSYYPTFNNLKDTICSYYRTKRFNLNIIKYLPRQIT